MVKYVVGFISLLALFSTVSYAQYNIAKPTETITKKSVELGKDYNYDIQITQNGKMPTLEDPKSIVDINNKANIKISMKFSKTEKTKDIIASQSLISGELNIYNNKIAADKGLFPNLTILLDKSWMVSSVLGINEQAAEVIPLVKYNNLSVLFFNTPDGETHKINEPWTTSFSIKNLPGAYKITNEIVEINNDLKTVRIKQNIENIRDNTSDIKPIVKTTAVSTYNSDNWLLINSVVNSDVTFPQCETKNNTPIGFNYILKISAAK